MVSKCLMVFEVFDVLMFLKCLMKKCLMKKGFEVFDVFKVFDEKGFRNVLMVSKCLMKHEFSKCVDVFKVFDEKGFQSV